MTDQRKERRGKNAVKLENFSEKVVPFLGEFVKRLWRKFKFSQRADIFSLSTSTFFKNCNHVVRFKLTWQIASFEKTVLFILVPRDSVFNGAKVRSFWQTPMPESVELFKWSDYENLPPAAPKNSGARLIAGSDGKVVSRKKALPIFLPWFESTFKAL